MNKTYNSKKAQWEERTALFLPKASLLTVQFFRCVNCTHLFALLYFQHEFYMSQAWWIATGIDIKMEVDVKAKMRSDGFEPFWTEPTTRENRPLEIIHVIASLVLLSGGLVLAFITFMGEKLRHGLTKKAPTNQGGEAWTVTNKQHKRGRHQDSQM